MSRGNKLVLTIFIVLALVLGTQSVLSAFGCEFIQSWRWEVCLVIAVAVVGATVLYQHRGKIDLQGETEEREHVDADGERGLGQRPSPVNSMLGVGWFFRWMRREGWVYSFGLILLIAVGFALRLHNLDASWLSIDEGHSANVARGILSTGKPIFPGSEVVYARSLSHTYLVAAFLGLDDSVFLGRLPSVLFGVLSIFVTYLIAKDLFGKRVALLSAFLLCFSTWSLLNSRDLRMYQEFQLFFLLSCFFMLKEPSKRNAVLIVFLSILTVLTNRIGVVLIPILVFYVIMHRDRLRYRGRVLVPLLICASAGIYLAMHFMGLGFGDGVFGGFFTGKTLAVLADECGLIILTCSLIAVVSCVVAWEVRSAISKNGHVNTKNIVMISICYLVPLLVIDCVVYSDVPGLRPNYIYLVQPLVLIFFVAALFLGIRLLLKHARDYAVAAVTSGVVVLLASCYAGFSFTSSRVVDIEKDGYADFQRISDYIEEVDQDVAPTIIAHPTSLMYYYYGRVDYYLNEDSTETDLYTKYDSDTDRRIDIYTGAELLDSLERLQQVSQTSPKGYIVFEKTRMKFLEPATSTWIDTNLAYLGSVSDARFTDEGDDEEPNMLTVYYWDYSE